MKKITLLLVTLSLFLCPPVYGGVLGGMPDSSDDEGYLSKAHLFVTADEATMSNNEHPWIAPPGFPRLRAPDPQEWSNLPLREHWFRLSKQKPVVLRSKGKVKFVVACDLRLLGFWELGPLQVKSGKNTIEFLIKGETSIRALSKAQTQSIGTPMSLWKTDAVVENLKSHTYRVYLHKTFVGELKVVK